MPINLLKQFLRLESLSSVILLIAALVALVWANSPLRSFYSDFTHEENLFWINEGLMSFFFLIVGLELKGSYLEGKFASIARVILPLVTAIGGMLIPALIYVLFNLHNPAHLSGWAIPVATDIAFAVGILSLFNNRVPVALKLFLLALAIFDDIGAIIIISIFYSQTLYYPALFIAGCFVVILFMLNRLGVMNLLYYLLAGFFLWYSLFETGIHPTIAGVILAFAIPGTEQDSDGHSPLYHLEQSLHPWVAYLIVPLFALANAGVSLERLSYDMLTNGIVLGIAVGLFLGKQIGVMGSAWIFIRLKYTQLPQNTSWLALYGVAILCGIGFTMSLFLGTLAFQNASIHLAEVRLGVIMGSIFSGVCGALVLSIAFANQEAEEDSGE